jgi:hypothetical protein
MAADRDRDYDVGYGKPPRHTRFKKGRSGNPKGRPKGAKNSTTLLNEALSEPVVITHNGRRKTVSKKQAIMMQIVNKAASGDHRAIQLLLLNQIPLIEERLAATQPATGEAPLALAPSAEEKRARALEIARILKDIGYLDQVLDRTPGAATSAAVPSSTGKRDC